MMTRIRTLVAVGISFVFICCEHFAASAADSVQKQIKDAENRFWSAPADEEENPIKWDTTEKGFPKIDGVWDDGVEGKARQVVNFKQTDDKFTATCVYQNPKEGEFHWRFEGSITKDGRVTGKLQHTKGPKYMLEHVQMHVAILSPDGKTIRGRAIYHDGGGGHDYVWTRSDSDQEDGIDVGENKVPGKAGGGQPKAIDPWADAKIGARAGDLFVCVTDARIRKVAVKSLGQDGKSEKSWLVVELHITNNSDSQKYGYSGWSSKSLDRDKSDDAALSDNLGNRYSQRGLGIGDDVVGQLEDGASVYPGKTVVDLLVFEPPVDKATELRFSLPGKAIGTKEALRVKIPINAPNRDGVIFNRDEATRIKRESEERARAEQAKAEKRRAIEEKLAKPDPERDEKAAESLLGNAQKLLRSGKTAAYRETLQKIIEKYPNTNAAETARTRLK